MAGQQRPLLVRFETTSNGDNVVMRLHFDDDALGEAFHSRRLRLVSSQVGKVAPSHRSRWTHRRRLAAALALLDAPALDLLLAPAIAFEELPAKLPSVFACDSDGVCPLIRYPAADDIH